MSSSKVPPPPPPTPTGQIAAALRDHVAPAIRDLAAAVLLLAERDKNE